MILGAKYKDKRRQEIYLRKYRHRCHCRIIRLLTELREVTEDIVSSGGGRHISELRLRLLGELSRLNDNEDIFNMMKLENKLKNIVEKETMNKLGRNLGD